MKKLFAIALSLLLVAAMAACAKTPEVTEAGKDTATQPASVEQQTEPAPIQEQTLPTEPEQEEGFFFMLKDVKLVPGAVFDEAAMPENSGVFQVPSCAIEGTDNLYNYNSVEVTVFDDGTQPVIYSIYIMDANTPTQEGLRLGDSVEDAIALYGEDYIQSGAQMVYTKGETQLILLADNGSIINIEYRMVI